MQSRGDLMTYEVYRVEGVARVGLSDSRREFDVNVALPNDNEYCCSDAIEAAKVYLERRWNSGTITVFKVRSSVRVDWTVETIWKEASDGTLSEV